MLSIIVGSVQCIAKKDCADHTDHRKNLAAKVGFNFLKARVKCWSERVGGQGYADAQW